MLDVKRYQAELGPEQALVDAALAQLRALTIASEEAFAWAGAQLLEAKARAQALEAKRKEITGPILAAKTAVDNLFKPLIGRYEQAEEILKAKIGDWTSQVEANRRAIMQSSAQEYQAGGTPTAIIPEPAKVQGISVRKVWEFEITDPAAVPRELCSPDGTKIRAWIKMGHTASVPGVRIFERDQVSARTGKS
jgi:hypothetical protein